MHDVPWSHYESLLAARGDAPVPRMAYLTGELELTSPSLDHEMIAEVLGQLILTFALHRGIKLQPTGSWTIRSAPKERGVEADKSYTIGDPRGRTAPDLAVEVVWTHGGIDKLEIFRGLGVGEVCCWLGGRIEVYVLRDGAYERASESSVLRGLDVQLVARLATQPLEDAMAQLLA
jgi:Uma2 family endonuclease